MHSLLAQMFSDIRASETLQVVKSFGQTSGSFLVAPTAIVENICVLKAIHTIHVWVPVRQHVLQPCIDATQHTNAHETVTTTVGMGHNNRVVS